MFLRLWHFTRAVLRLGDNSALQIKQLGTKFLWKQIQIVLTSERYGEVNASKAVKQCAETTCAFSLLRFCGKNMSSAVKICVFRLITHRPGLIQIVNLQVKTSKGLS